jgi:segregation and condensation protein A
VDQVERDGTTTAPGFAVHLDVFDGPFDLLLTLIAKHELDVTVVALSTVTEEFLAYLRAGQAGKLDQASEFVVVAATLLDLKAARLLPVGDVEDDEDIAALEARDLLFARLLQYRAFKQIAAMLGPAFEQEALRFGRMVPPETACPRLRRDVTLGVDARGLAAVAARALAPREPPSVPVDHLHLPVVSVREQAVLLARRLRASRSATFRRLCTDCASTLEVVARFLALLELHREGAVAVEQAGAFADVHVRWVDGATPEPERWSADDATAPAADMSGAGDADG